LLATGQDHGTAVLTNIRPQKPVSRRSGPVSGSLRELMIRHGGLLRLSGWACPSKPFV